MPEHLVRPRLYLDIDGVLIASPPAQPAFETKKLNRVDRYSPEVTGRLGALAAKRLELVFLSDWDHEAAGLIEAIDDFAGARILPLAPLDPDITAETSTITRKAFALLDEQEQSPTPFIWGDNDINQNIRDLLAERLVTPQLPWLLICPNKHVGVNEQELSQIEAFAKLHIPR